jgi:exopolysaccharide production protein ExoZ
MEWLKQRFELARAGAAQNVRPMEGLRGFAVLLVFLVHYVTSIHPWLAGTGLIAFMDAVHTVGNSGVDLFFVLSGYLIYGTLMARAQGFWPFMARRVARIYPVFIVLFAVYVALSIAMPAESKIPEPAFDAALYLAQNFLLLPGIFPVEPMITVAWSLSYEMLYYLLIPLLIAILGLRERSALWRVCLFAIAAVPWLVYCGSFGGPIRLAMFIAGILLYEAACAGKRAPGGAAALAALVAGLLSTLATGVFALKVALLGAAFFVLCFSCFARPHEWLGRAFSWTPLRWLGNMSYSYYLVHGLALKAGFMALASVLPAAASDGALLPAVLLLPMFGLTLVPAAVLFLTVERPFSLKARPLRGAPSGIAPGSC